jgi:hypothetical protein
VAALTTRIALAAAVGVFALIVLGTTLWFLGDAMMLALEEHDFRPSAAAGLTGLAGLVITGICGLVAKSLVSSHRRRVPPPSAAVAAGSNGSAMNGIAADLGALVARQLADSSRKHPYTTMGAALAAGLAMGAVPELRKAITDLVKH